MKSALWAVVVNWNGGEANLACLDSLAAEGVAPERTVFVDNASTDGSRERVAALHPRVRLLASASNEGYGHGTNRGVRVALDEGAEAVLLVNNDVTWPAGEGALDLLESALAREGVGVVGPRVVYAREPGRVWAAGGFLTWRANLTRMVGHRRPDGPDWQLERSVDYVPGCAMLVRRAVFERAGLLRGEYFAYHEDVEFCLAARAAGFDVRVVGAVRALHDAHHSTGGGYNPARKYMMGVNTVWFLRRHGTPGRWLSFLVFDVCSLPFVWLARAWRGESAGVVAKARGTLDGLRGKRVTEQSLARYARGG